MTLYDENLNKTLEISVADSNLVSYANFLCEKNVGISRVFSSLKEVFYAIKMQVFSSETRKMMFLFREIRNWEPPGRYPCSFFSKETPICNTVHPRLK